MSDRQYTAPPIIDAVIELRFEDTLTDSIRNRVSKKLASKYPIEEEVVQQQVLLAVEEGTVATHSSVQERLIRRRSSESPMVVQVGTRVLDVATGAPYSGWEELFDRFLDDWATAKKVWKYRRIERIGVRYINRIDLRQDEAGACEYEEYLNLRINLPEQFPPIFGYDLGFQSSVKDIKCGVTVRSGSTAPAVPGRQSFVLDIDVWREVEVPQRDEDVCALLAEMRKAKNNLFETFITDKAREVFNAH